MTATTAPIAIIVVTADTISIQRARATRRCASDSAEAAPADNLPGSWPDKLLMITSRKSIRVADHDSGGRLDRVLAAHVAELSRSRLKTLIEAGAVALDGRTIRDPSHRVNSGAEIVLDIPPPQAAKPEAEPIPLAVIYEDDDIIVIDKPRDLVVHPA